MKISSEGIGSLLVQRLAQQEIAQSLIIYSHIDLTIPAQRYRADIIRRRYGLPDIGETAVSNRVKLKAEVPVSAPTKLVCSGVEPQMKAAVAITAIGIGES